MPSISGTLCRLAIHATTFLALHDISSRLVFGNASPVPRHFVAPDYSLDSASLRKSTLHDPAGSNRAINREDSNIIAGTKLSSRLVALYARSVASKKAVQKDVNLQDVQIYRQGMRDNANKLQSLAQKSASVQNNDYDFHQETATTLTNFDTNLLGLQSLLAPLAADKGLANFDKKYSVEETIKEIVNANKEALSSITTISYNIPVLGPVLGPIVYEVKCVLDDVLDFTESVADELINDLAPLLVPIINLASPPPCQSGIDILKICI